jgi:hypothetical protein
MAINYWRRVDSDHDGHITNECLQRYGRFTGGAYGWRYCPLCGTEWVGEQTETEEQRERRYTEDRHRWSQRDNRPTVSRWVIEYREWSQWQDEPVKWGQWGVRHRLYPGEGAVVALKELRYYRSMEAEDRAENEPLYVGFRHGTEYRARVVTE